MVGSVASTAKTPLIARPNPIPSAEFGEHRCYSSALAGERLELIVRVSVDTENRRPVVARRQDHVGIFRARSIK